MISKGNWQNLYFFGEKQALYFIKWFDHLRLRYSSHYYLVALVRNHNLILGAFYANRPIAEGNHKIRQVLVRLT